MNSLFSLAMLVTLAVIWPGYSAGKSNQSGQNNGYRSYGNETVDFVQANGAVVLNGTQVLGEVNVNGSLQANNATIDSLQVNGSATLRSCQIANNCTINGGLVADSTKFKGEISVASQKITLSACSVDSLVVRKTGSASVPVVILQNGTKVTGSIIVESGNGEIWVSSGSEVSSDVSGAKIIQK
jgi:hypothetical protein